MIVQAFANALTISLAEARFFVTLFSIFPLTIIYQLIPCSKNSVGFKQQIFFRKLYGLIVGLLLLLFLYTWDQILATFLTFVFSYFGATRCRTKRKTIKWNLMNFIILTIAHLYRVVYFFNQDVYNINFILMMALPRQMYFNYWVLNIVEDKKFPEQKNPMIQVKEDEDVTDEEIPSFLNYICYMFNFVGNFTSPIFTYQEYKHFIQRSFDYKNPNRKFGLSKLVQFISLVALYVFKGKLLALIGDVYSQEFRSKAVWYQVLSICVYAFIIRTRYYVGFLMGDLNAYLGNLRDSVSKYEDYVQCIDILKIETHFSPKKRIPAWNMTIAKWLRAAIYQPIMEEYNLSTNKASLLTFALSAFWHGLQPNYYIGFFVVNLVTQIEKFVYRKKIKYFPSFFYYFIFNLGGIIFKAIDTKLLLELLQNIWIYLVLLVAVYMATRYAPRKLFVKPEIATIKKNK